MLHADGDGEDLEEGEVLEALERFKGLSEADMTKALDRAADNSAMGKYENQSAKRGNRAGAYGEVGPGRMKNDLIDLEESVRPGLKKTSNRSTNYWEKERSRWLQRVCAQCPDPRSFASLAMRTPARAPQASLQLLTEDICSAAWLRGCRNP